MRKAKKVVKVISVIFLVVLVVVLWATCASRDRKIERQAQIINMYEAVYGIAETDKEEEANNESESPVIVDNEEIERLTRELESVKVRVDKLEQQNTTTIVEDNVYLSIKFPYDGNYYKEAGDVQYYADPTCTEKISNVRFMSSYVDNAQAENGIYIYCLRMDNGEICYSVQSPWLITEEEYEEMKTE